VKKIRYGESARHLADSGVEMLTVEEYEKIRRAHYIEQKSIRQIAREQGHSRKTVKKALASGGPGRYTQKSAREAPVLGPYKERIEALLVEAQQNATQATLHQPQDLRNHARCRLQRSEPGIRRYIGRGDANTRHLRCICRWKYEPGADAQADWGEGLVVMNGTALTVQLFSMRLCYSRRLFVMAFPNQKMESFLEAQVSAFHFFEGVPHRISYDNLKPRERNPGWTAGGKNRPDSWPSAVTIYLKAIL